MGTSRRAPKTALPSRIAVFALLAAVACTESKVIGEGQFGRPIALSSDPAAPLPRMVWRPGQACPGPAGGCDSFCVGPPDSCASTACMPLLIDSGTPLSILPSADGSFEIGSECVELRAGAGLLDSPDDPATLDGATASFRFRDAPMVRAPGHEVEGWAWEAGDDRQPIGIGGVIGGNILRDFAIELRHLDGEQPTVKFFSQYPGSESVLADQGRAYLRLQYPSRLLGRLLNDRCEIGDGIDCRLSRFDLSVNTQELLFETTRALVDACVAPPPCAVSWSEADGCELDTRGQTPSACAHEQGESATLVVATGVPGLVLFADSAAQMFGPLDQLPACDQLDPAALGPNSEVQACAEADVGRLVLPGWPALEQLTRIRVRALGLAQGLDQPTGTSPCQRVRNRLEGLRRQCRGFALDGRPVQPGRQTGTSVASSVLVIGEVELGETAAGPNPDAWIDTLVVPATAPPVIAVRREVVPEGAQPDGLVGGALLRNTETVLDFTEPVESPGLRVRCLDPGDRCLAIPACEVDNDGASVQFEGGEPGRTGCCFGLPTNLIARVVLEGSDKNPPRIEDACCSALSRAAITDLQTPGLDLCTGVDLP